MIPYIGGKSFLASWIIENFPADYKNRTYIEVFGGAGWVMLKKDESFLEIYNDLNKELVNLFRIIRDNYEEFKHRAEWSLHSREMYAEAKEKLKDDSFLTELERAMYYAIDRGQCFGGKANGSWGYQVTAKKTVSGKWLPFIKRLDFVNARLKKVQIECLDFEKLIKKYDHKNAFFYLDPPYYNAEFYYNTVEVNFKEADHRRLSNLLKGVEGKFALSYYEEDIVLDLYKDFRIINKDGVKHSRGCTRTLKNVPKPKTCELLIMNY